MSQGCLIFSHNGEIDYGSQAVLAAKLAHKHLGIPISLISDADTVQSIKSKFSTLPFDNIIEVPKPNLINKRRLDGKLVSFINSNRNSAWELTPYDRTLLIDSDFLIFSNTLEKYWNSSNDFLITPGMLDLQENKIAPKEYEVSPYSINMLWATNIMFSKTPETKLLFELVEYIKKEYQYFSSLYEFDPRQYRNDYAFSIACHIFSAHGLDGWHGELPVPLLFKDSDEIINIKEDGQVTFLCKDFTKLDNYLLAKTKSQDVHIMNKKTILDNLDQLLELANE